jgi:hypothetical protein
MMVVWNGAPSLNLNDLSAGVIVGAIFGVMGVSAVVTILFFYPFLYRKLVKEDWQLRWYNPSQFVLTSGTTYFWVHSSGNEVPFHGVPKNNVL